MSCNVEENNGNKFLRVSQQGYDYTFGYYSCNSWVDDERIVLLRLPRTEDKTAKSEFVLFNLKDNSEKLLGETDSKFFYTVYKEKLYYANNDKMLYCMDLEAMEIKPIYKGEYKPTFPHMTADGRYMNWHATADDNTCMCMRMDMQTGEVIKMFEKKFSPPFHIANHMMICPTNENLVFFAHEGDTRYITNRLWLAPMNEEPYNIAPQRLDENGNLIDCFGHETWATDGKGIYFVKYACSPSKPVGIGYVNIATKKHEILYTGNQYWHVCASPNNRLLAADLQPKIIDGKEMSAICLIDTEAKTEKILVNVRNNPQHPGHPHPCFNPTSNKICFHDIIDEDTVTVGIMNI